MEMIILEFLLGTVAGTFFGILKVKRSGRTSSTLKKARVARASAYKPRIRSTRAKTGARRPRTVSRTQARSVTAPTETVVETLTKDPIPTANVMACPACGLQAPEKLMAEHFLGSPSHKHAPVEPQLTEVETKTARVATPDEDARDSLRSLLQMLVPPRAFGRRHGQRTINPLSSLVQTSPSARDTGI